MKEEDIFTELNQPDLINVNIQPKFYQSKKQ